MGVIDMAALIFAGMICVAVTLFLLMLLFVTVDEKGWRFEVPWRAARNKRADAPRATQRSSYRSRHYHTNRASASHRF